VPKLHFHCAQHCSVTDYNADATTVLPLPIYFTPEIFPFHNSWRQPYRTAAVYVIATYLHFTRAEEHYAMFRVAKGMRGSPWAEVEKMITGFHGGLIAIHYGWK
jgi:hypothetical protein